MASVATATADITIEDVTKRFEDVVAVDDLSLEVPRGTFFALLGPSGCGKTTTLRMIGGFDEPSEGRILLGDEDVVGLPPYKRDVNTVFQSYALFPHLSIFENIAFGLRRKGVDRKQLKGRVQEMLRLVGLEGVENRKPRQLSGGQQQRVALARALVNGPRVLLLDEPLGALDLKLRKQMQLELKRIQHEMGLTFVHVTHDQEEAMTMADTIAVMHGGKIEQLGTPTDLYERPRTAFVAGFLGVSNLLSGVVEGERGVRLDDGTIRRARRRRPRREGRGRRSPREDQARRGRREPAAGRRQGDRLRRRGHAADRGDRRRRRGRVPPERRGGQLDPGRRLERHGQLEPRRNLRRRPGGNDVMNRPLTRRELLRRGAAGATVLSLPSLLAACGGSEDTATTTSAAAKELADTLRFSNWPYYIDYIEKTKQRPTLDQFTAKTGVKVDYFEDINDNASYFGKIQGPLSQGRGIDRDIIVLTDNSRFPGLMIKKGWAEKLDKSAIPNIVNLQPALKSPPFDPTRTYSLPWQSGMTGIATNKSVTGGKTIVTVEQLLEDPALKGKVTLLTEMADTMGVVMQANGDDPTKVTDSTFKSALDRIQKAVDSGQVRQFTGNDYTGPLAKGNLAAALSWSGDVVQLIPDNNNLEWNLPETGGMIWTDNMLIPTDGDVYTASTYMNFVYDPKIAAQIAAYIQYVSPVKGTKEELAKTDPALAKNTLIFPDAATLSNVKGFDAEALNNEDYIQQWQQLLGA